MHTWLRCLPPAVLSSFLTRKPSTWAPLPLRSYQGVCLERKLQMQNQVNHYNLIHPTFLEHRVDASHFTEPSHNGTPKFTIRSTRQSIINAEHMIYWNITQKYLGPLNKIFKPKWRAQQISNKCHQCSHQPCYGFHTGWWCHCHLVMLGGCIWEEAPPGAPTLPAPSRLPKSL